MSVSFYWFCSFFVVSAAFAGLSVFAFRQNAKRRSESPKGTLQLVRMVSVDRPCVICGKALNMSTDSVLALRDDGKLVCREHVSESPKGGADAR